MSEKISALYSSFVIDGIREEFTPARLLQPLCDARLCPPQGAEESCCIDETVDPVARSFDVDSADVAGSLEAILSARRIAPPAYADSYTRFRIASALEDALWKKGAFRLGDLSLVASWKCDARTVGAMAAFYRSVTSAADYVDSLGLRFADVSCTRGGAGGDVAFRALVARDSETDEFFTRDPFRSVAPRFSSVRACPPTLVPDPQSWIVYIPFDTADFRLGGSLLAQVFGIGGAPVQITDADCFIDCFEVVREFVEDGLLLSGATVADGGLLTALSRMAEGNCAVEADISAIMHSCQEKYPLRVLFAELPGVIIQIRDSDFDYLDAELLLQDVAYFPLGHPDPSGRGVRVKSAAKSGIQTILESLIRNAEGED